MIWKNNTIKDNSMKDATYISMGTHSVFLLFFFSFLNIFPSPSLCNQTISIFWIYYLVAFGDTCIGKGVSENDGIR